jgi:hypothetical protein
MLLRDFGLSAAFVGALVCEVGSLDLHRPLEATAPSPAQ